MEDFIQLTFISVWIGKFHAGKTLRYIQRRISYLPLWEERKAESLDKNLSSSATEKVLSFCEEVKTVIYLGLFIIFQIYMSPVLFETEKLF